MDPRWEKYPGWSPYVYALDNPILYVDPNGDTVRVVIQRTEETSQATMGTVTVTSTETDGSFSGYSLEPPPNGQYTRTKAGTYPAYQRKKSSTGEDYKPPRIQLDGAVDEKGKPVPHQLHVGNTPDETTGCVLCGETSTKNEVGGGRNAMVSINKIITKDGGPVYVTIKNLSQPVMNSGYIWDTRPLP